MFSQDLKADPSAKWKRGVYQAAGVKVVPVYNMSSVTSRFIDLVAGRQETFVTSVWTGKDLRNEGSGMMLWRVRG